MIYITIAIAAYLRVLFKVLQQFNVLYFRWWLVLPTSIAFTLSEFYIWGGLVYAIQDGFEKGIGVAVSAALAAAAGSYTGMYLNRRLDVE